MSTNIIIIIIKCACFVTLSTNVFVVSAEKHTELGTTLYTLSDIKRKWTDTDSIELQWRMLVGSLVPTKMPEDENDFLNYFVSIKNNTDKIDSAVGRKRALVMVADAIGGYLYAKMLPQIRILYYEGKLKYSTTKRLHDLMRKIKYVLGTDGRGWARPAAGKPSGGRVDRDAAVARTDKEVAAAGRCGGVDAGPYGLQRLRWQRPAVEGVDVPFFDNQTRPHSVVVPWRPARPVLFGVRDSGCHRALFDHCAGAVPRQRPADAAAVRRVRALRSWVDAAVLPLVTPAAAAGRWYPALWGASLAARRLEQATVAARADDGHGAADDGHGPADDGHGAADAENTDYPNVNFYAFVVLVSAFLCWTAALCTLLRGPLLSALAPLQHAKERRVAPFYGGGNG